MVLKKLLIKKVITFFKYLILMINSKSKNRNLSQEDVFNFSELFKLMKPRVMSLVIFTCAVGLLMAPITITTKDAMIAILLVSIGAGAAGALNMWYESDLDALMTRTCLRPIPMGKVNKKQALIFGTSLSFFSVIALDYFANTISAALLLFTILFYVFVYTIWLKRKTPQNIVIGGAAGALPPVIGWTIATNSLSLEPITFFLIIFFWTPSHFWALSLYKSDDYKKAKIPMLPLTNGIESTKMNIFVYSLLMLPMVILPYTIGLAGLVFLVPALMLTLYYNILCFELYKFKKNKFEAKKAKTIFGYSILYLFLIFVIFLIDKIL
jgi:heme o synthase